MVKLTGSQYLADTFEGYGATHVFVMPAILQQTLADIEERTSIDRIIAHSEKAAVYMADGYARASGRPGICMAQTIGAANLAAALRDPYLACTPMIALTGGPFTHTRGRNTYQEIDDMPMFKPVTKSTAFVDTVGRLPDTLRQAFRVATTGTPGPTYIQIAGHQGQVEEQEGDLDVTVEPEFGQVPAFRPIADDTSIKAALDRLARAERPIIVAGGGARVSGAHAEVVALAEKLGIPVATALNAKEIIPNDHPLAVGVPGSYSRRSANRAVMESDLVFYVGSHTGSQVTWDWRIPPLGHPVIQLDINPEELGHQYRNDVSLYGDAKVTLARMIELADGDPPSGRQAWMARTATLVQEYRNEVAELQNSEAEPIRPERITNELSKMLPPDALLVSDTGHSGMWTGGMVDLNYPAQRYIRCAGSLGWGLPGVLGAKLGAPDLPVVLWTGDGGLLYHWTEMETALRWNIDVTIVVNNNDALNQGLNTMKKIYGGELHGRHGDMWKYRRSNFAAMAEAMGGQGIRVEQPGQLAAALEQGLATPGPFVVDVATDDQALAPVVNPADVSG